MHSRTRRDFAARRTPLEQLNDSLTAIALILALALGVTASLRYEIGSIDVSRVELSSP